MASYLMVVLSSAKPGRDDEYSDWYENVHMREICAIPGIVSGHRYEADSASISKPDGTYLGIFEAEADDPSEIMEEMRRRHQAGVMGATSDALDPESTRIMWFKKRV